jgi:glycolate oxidase iron-sulfur subunit
VDLTDIASNFFPTDKPDSGKIIDCMHCGVCLPTCPTYILTGDERSSPRGRIALMKGIDKGQLTLSETFDKEMFFCLGCLACTTACPAGVDYSHLIEHSRAQALQAHPGSFVQKTLRNLIFSCFEQPSRLKLLGKLFQLYQKLGLQWFVRTTQFLKLLPGKLAEKEAMLPSETVSFSSEVIPEMTPAQGLMKAKVGVLLGCVMDFFFTKENQATVSVLSRNGCDVYAPKAGGCCGALHAHAGLLPQAREMAKKQIELYEKAGVEKVIVNSAGCGAAMKDYQHWLEEDGEWAGRAKAFSAKVKDIQEYLVESGCEIPKGSSSERTTYHDACHLCHGQKITQQPREILKSLAGDKYTEMTNPDRCCGSAGIYNVTHFDESMKLLDDKVNNIVQSGAKVVGVANPGCLLQIQYGLKKAGSSVRAEHPVVLLEEAYRSRERGDTLGKMNEGTN